MKLKMKDCHIRRLRKGMIIGQEDLPLLMIATVASLSQNIIMRLRDHAETMMTLATARG